MTTYPNPGFITDVVGTTGRIEATWGNAVRDRLVHHFTSTASRDAAIPSPVEGQVCVLQSGGLPQVHWYNGSAWLIQDLGWVSYTPQLDQGASTNISKTINVAKYQRRFLTCRVRLSLSITGSGTAGAAVTVTYPVTGAGLASAEVIGSGEVNDASVQLYVCSVLDNGGSTFRWRTNGAGVFGQSPSVAVVSGDLVQAVIEYPIVA